MEKALRVHSAFMRKALLLFFVAAAFVVFLLILPENTPTKIYDAISEASPGTKGLFLLNMLWAFCFVTYAARRRTQMRETFGIAGNRTSDFFSWLCCPLCAYFQERRTWQSYNVHVIEWHGPPHLEAPTQPVMQAQVVKEMEVAFPEPVDAENIV